MNFDVNTLKLAGFGALGLGAFVTLFLLMRGYFKQKTTEVKNKILINREKRKNKIYRDHVEATERENRRHAEAVSSILNRNRPFGADYINRVLNEREPKDSGK